MNGGPLRNSNQLLARFSNETLTRLESYCQPTKLEVGTVLYEVHSAIEYAYFPNYGVLSAIVVMNDGNMIEVATVGNEGGVGIRLSAGSVSPHKMIVQIPGDGVRIYALALAKEADENDSVRQLLESYASAFMFQVSQSVACNGLHTLQQRCCRWLLMTHDRLHTDEITLTHEYLAIMLGVRRASVTEVLQILVDQGHISTARGRITVLDRAGMEAASCECYGVVRDEYLRVLNHSRPPG